MVRDRPKITSRFCDPGSSIRAFSWPVREGENVLEVRPVNACGRAGITSRLEVAYAPARW